MIYLPSLANFRANWLDDRLRIGIVAGRVLDAVPDVMALPRNLTDRLLTSAGANAIVYRREGQSQLIELADRSHARAWSSTADMRQRDLPTLIVGALDTLFLGGDRTLRIVGESDGDENAVVEVLMPERAAARTTCSPIRATSSLISLIVAALTAVALYLRRAAS